MDQKDRKIIVVTGATGTIGSAICKHLVQAGYFLVLATREKSKGESLMYELGASHSFYQSVDVSDEKSVQTLFSSSIFHNATLAGVVTCAGMLKMGPTDTFEPASWDQTLSTNTSGTFYVFRHALGIMRTQRTGGTLIAIGSRWDKGAKNATAYAASKSALQGMIASMQKEYAGSTIRPILISPGSVASPMSASVKETIPQELVEASDIAQLVGYIFTTPQRVIFNEITMLAYNYDLTDEYAQ